MNLQELIRQSEVHFRSHIVDKEAFKARFFARLAHEQKSPTNMRAPAARNPANPIRLASVIKHSTSAGIGLALACSLVAVVVRPHDQSIDKRSGTANATYFGVEPPFRPMLPAHMLSGYKLTTSGWDMSLKNNETHFVAYLAQFDKSGRASIPYSWISIYEFPGSSVKIKKQAGVPGSGIAWNKSVRIHNQTYYISNTRESAVGFVKNHVVYILSMPSGHMEKALLECAQNMSVVAPIQWAERSATTYQDAMENISFHPVVPRLPSQYVNVGTGSEVFKKGNDTSELFVLDYQNRNARKESVQIVEVPLGSAIKPFDHAGGTNRIVWKDQRRGIEFTVQGNGFVSKRELQKIADILRSTSN